MEIKNRLLGIVNQVNPDRLLPPLRPYPQPGKAGSTECKIEPANDAPNFPTESPTEKSHIQVVILESRENHTDR